MRHKTWIGIAVAAVALVGSAGFRVARSAEETEAANPPQAEPQRTEAFVPTAPLRMMAGEAEPLMEQLRRLAAERAAAESGEDAEASDADDGGGSRVIDIDGPPVVNYAPHFKFRDATPRRVTGATPQDEQRPTLRLSPKQRSRTVEAFRQAVAKRRERAGN